jgi:serine/threonine protein kinase
MSIQPGARLGPYEVLSTLGAGGMGEVWKAKNTRATRRPFADFDPAWITGPLGLSPDGKRRVLSESERVFSVMVAEGTRIVPRLGSLK